MLVLCPLPPRSLCSSGSGRFSCEILPRHEHTSRCFQRPDTDGEMSYRVFATLCFNDQMCTVLVFYGRPKTALPACAQRHVMMISC